MNDASYNVNHKSYSMSINEIIKTLLSQTAAIQTVLQYFSINCLHSSHSYLN